MYLDKDRIRCASLVSGVLGLVGSALFLSAIILPWWDVGSSEELLNLRNAPPVVAGLWGFQFLNPPSWVTRPMPREPSTWQAYCERDAAREEEEPAPVLVELNETDEEGEATETSTTSVTSSVLENVTDFNESNLTSTTTRTVTHTRTTTSSITSVTTLHYLEVQERLTTPVPDPPLHPGTCELVPFLPTLLIAASALGPGAVLLYIMARFFSSLLALLAGALAAASACGLGAITIFMAGVLSFRGLLSALGPQLVVAGMAFAGGSAVLAVFCSIKALKQMPFRQVAVGGEAEESDEDEEKGQIEKEEQQQKRPKQPRMQRLKVAKQREQRKQRYGHRRAMVEVKPKSPEAMMKLLNWGHRKGQGGRFGKKVPMKWIEDAFNEIDVERHGYITLEEFMAAVGRCGLVTVRASFERVLQDINQETKGQLDLKEFVSFFRLVEESLRKDASRKSRAMMSLYLCNFCFCLHVALLCTLLMIIVQRETNASPEDREDSLHQAEGQLLSTTLQLVAMSLFGFFISVVAVPLLRLTVGSSIGAWCGHFAGVLHEWRRRWRGEEVEEDEGEVEAAPSRNVSGMSRRTSTDASMSRRTSRASLGSLPSRSSVGSNTSQKPWWTRLERKLFSVKKKRRKRRASCLEDSMYDASRFEDAKLRAMAATAEPVSSFSPMQVRNLHVAHLPSTVAATPPTQLAPYLPGAPGYLESSEDESGRG